MQQRNENSTHHKNIAELFTKIIPNLTTYFAKNSTVLYHHGDKINLKIIKIKK
jgi:hypothetical protein